VLRHDVQMCINYIKCHINRVRVIHQNLAAANIDLFIFLILCYFFYLSVCVHPFNVLTLLVDNDNLHSFTFTLLW